MLVLISNIICEVWGNYSWPSINVAHPTQKYTMPTHPYVMIFLLKQGLCIKIDFYDNSLLLDFYDHESKTIFK